MQFPVAADESSAGEVVSAKLTGEEMLVGTRAAHECDREEKKMKT